MNLSMILIPINNLFIVIYISTNLIRINNYIKTPKLLIYIKFNGFIE